MSLWDWLAFSTSLSSVFVLRYLIKEGPKDPFQWLLVLFFCSFAIGIPLGTIAFYVVKLTKIVWGKF